MNNDGVVFPMFYNLLLKEAQVHKSMSQEKDLCNLWTVQFCQLTLVTLKGNINYNVVKEVYPWNLYEN